MNFSTSSEQVIRRLYQITNDHYLGFDMQIIKLLEMGLERFNLDIGILSKIEGNDYVIQQCVAPEELPLESGSRFDFEATYCVITCQANEPVAIEHMAREDELSCHPAYKAFGLEAYIGMPIYLNDEFYGTLNFSSPFPFPRQFDEVDIDALRLMVSWIEVELSRQKQEQQMKKLNEELAYLATHDSLTHAYNRLGMYQKLNESLQQLQQEKGEGALVAVDLDGFKKVNDEYGHKAGDDVLVQLVADIQQVLSAEDMVARIGGDEFIVWLPDQTEEKAIEVCDRILSNVNRTFEDSFHLTASIGLHCINFATPSKRVTEKQIDHWLSMADMALYQAKGAGKNCLVSQSNLHLSRVS
ncbi:sensor domain-containing diguanylate cyclase [Marinomonas epiphytica]